MSIKHLGKDTLNFKESKAALLYNKLGIEKLIDSLFCQKTCLDKALTHLRGLLRFLCLVHPTFES